MEGLRINFVGIAASLVPTKAMQSIVGVLLAVSGRVY